MKAGYFFFSSGLTGTLRSFHHSSESMRTRQRVVSTGVYGFARHPMYPGAILIFVRTLLMPGSC